MTHPYKFLRWDNETNAPIEVEVTPSFDHIPRKPSHLLIAIIGNAAVWVGLGWLFAWMMGWL